MIESEDGTVTGSIDVSRLDEIDPKTDEAKAQIEALKAENQAAQEQAAADAEKLAEQEKAQSAEGQKEAQKETTTKAAPVDTSKSGKSASHSSTDKG
jgi:restriction endonuclease S subunit